MQVTVAVVEADDAGALEEHGDETRHVGRGELQVVERDRGRARTGQLAAETCRVLAAAFCAGRLLLPHGQPVEPKR